MYTLSLSLFLSRGAERGLGGPRGLRGAGGAGPRAGAARAAPAARGRARCVDVVYSLLVSEF